MTKTIKASNNSNNKKCIVQLIRRDNNDIIIKQKVKNETPTNIQERNNSDVEKSCFLKNCFKKKEYINFNSL